MHHCGDSLCFLATPQGAAVADRTTGFPGLRGRSSARRWGCDACLGENLVSPYFTIKYAVPGFPVVTAFLEEAARRGHAVVPEHKMAAPQAALFARFFGRPIDWRLACRGGERQRYRG